LLASTLFFCTSRRRHTRLVSDWSSDVCSSDLYVTRALELIQRLPDGADRARQELELQMASSVALHMAVGPGSPEREKALVRALRSEERRVGKEGGSRWGQCGVKKEEDVQKEKR